MPELSTVSVNNASTISFPASIIASSDPSFHKDSILSVKDDERIASSFSTSATCVSSPPSLSVTTGIPLEVKSSDGSTTTYDYTVEQGVVTKMVIQSPSSTTVYTFFWE